MPARTLQDLVSAAASLHPDRAAVLYDSGSGETPGSLLYREVVQLAEDLSAALLQNCSPRGGAVGLYCSDDLLVPAWILGILQSSAAYVPLDPEAPGLLTARVMSQCGLKYCAVKRDLVQRFREAVVDHVPVEVCVELPQFRLTLMHIEPRPVAEDGPQRVGGCDPSDKTVPLKDSGRPDLAYVLHTSGTTGPPKTVRVPHRCIVPNILHLRSLFQMSADDVVFLASPLTFDPSVVDIFLALSSGALLLIVPSVMKKMPGRLAQMLFKHHRTTVLQVTPTLLVRFGPGILKRDVLSPGSSLRVLALGGEACPSPAQLRSWKHEENKTAVYNIYGVTEVSCWASCYRVPEPQLQCSSLPALNTAGLCSSVSSVPLGTPLMDTVVEVRNEDDCVITEGEGQVFIGGEDRVCLLDGEDTVVPGTMRATGDWVNVKDGQLYYLGRRDRMIKRNGKRVNLDSLQQLILSLPQVEACAVGLYKEFRLLAFVVASASEVRLHQGAPEGAGGDLQRLILKQLSLLVSAHCIPDALVLVPALSLTPHGKADMKALMRIYEKQRDWLTSSRLEVGKLKQTLETLWQDTLSLPADASIDERSNFLFSGGDSLKALRLCEDILSAVGVSSPRLLEVILDRSFSDVLRHVTQMLPPEPDGSSSSKKRAAEAASAVPAKKGPRPDRTQRETLGYKVVRRGGEVQGTNFRSVDAGEEEPLDGKDVGVRLGPSWSSDTGRCVDASPVILVQDIANEQSRATVFIGSHSHRIQALDLAGGNLLWERVLGDRIEASAAVCHCGSLVVVGSYDGCVYFLCTDSGETKWVFKTEDAVKSCPAVDPLTGLVVVGSHDGHVYALDPQLRRCVWKRDCGGGAVFSSPHLQPSCRRLYVATLGGRLLCLNLDSGDILWSYCRDKPFFSSPNSSCGRIAIGSVDGNICCLSDSGELLWQFQTEAPVFSSPSFVPGQQRLLCGSHDGRLYCLSCTNGSVVWTFQTSGKVYSTPCVFQGSSVGRRGALVGLASTDGTVWILDARDGRVLASSALPGELFSSPVVWEQSLVIGCRNDYVYCLNLTGNV
ncbi:beta-alanine-activating enzyme isoform X2 [Poecilia reticulata]|uniref:beta-alanine-activating enzyme isoform X1 n=1 Tax=Poecilia reticulata TaxID=8081 RepID=UPI0004A3CA09|nr:PREDICTED: acyl-CoA synthetase family member 4 isoform X1 [Poecilia reticulata]XP_008405667.1 PREDICTED: acyl-CoA synthetase family member 4 isoform X2 [Poecilia reticulata]